MSTEYLSQVGLKNLDYVQTGDILLFKSKGNRTSNLLSIGIRSSWTHVGVAIWEGGFLKVFESSLSEKVLDEVTGTFKRGARKSRLLDIVDRYASILVRPVEIPRTPTFYTKLDEFISEHSGKNYTTFLKIPFIPFLCMEDEGIHCSELVARYFLYVGLFDDKPGLKARCPFNFLPSDFSPESTDMEIDRLFTSSPSITIYNSASIQSPSLLFLCLLSFITAAVFLLRYVTK